MAPKRPVKVTAIIENAMISITPGSKFKIKPSCWEKRISIIAIVMEEMSIILLEYLINPPIFSLSRFFDHSGMSFLIASPKPNKLIPESAMTIWVDVAIIP